MIIKEATYKKQRRVQNVQVSEAIYGCDECMSEIKGWPNENAKLDMTVFFSDTDHTQGLHFCSWDCVINHLPKIKTTYFVSLPYLMFDGNSPKHANRLIELLKSISK